ncbi:site-specific integrase [Vibrio diabolicus]|uniref:tyrosine-type recombinase/integrase n=1 Tax=Vibrio diabolicus TaxID=50719 RepID=UPI00215F37F6|nr:site-specific integrase [Vibrio diabolicus]MCS0397904.1 site-specific integrase [Vibrio diabolicus]
MALSDSWLKANNAKERPIRMEKADRDGLSVRVTPKGKIIFQMRYRYNQKLQRLDLGSYPLMTLKEARDENQRLRKEHEQGHDPRIIRQLEKQSIADAVSLTALFLQWYGAYCKKNKKGHQEIKRSFEIHLLPELGKLPAEKITLHQWLELLETLSQNRPGIAERLLTNSKQMLKWAVKRKLLNSNVLAEINAKEDLQIKKVAGSRSLSDEEIRYVWLAIDESRMSAKNKLYVKLCLVFGCRNGELRLSEKKHFDLDTMVWTVPPENHKLGTTTGKPLLRPIIEEVKPLIEKAIDLSGRGKYLFNNSGTNEPMGRSAPLALPYNIMQWLRRHKDYELKHWSIHDLRKTARTNLSSLTEPHIAEIILGHRLPGTWQVYDHYDYLPEQKEAYAAWWKRLSTIVKG